MGGVGVLCLVWLAGWRLQRQASKQQASKLNFSSVSARLAFARPGKWCKVQVPVPVAKIAETDRACLRHRPIFTFTCLQ